MKKFYIIMVAVAIAFPVNLLHQFTVSIIKIMFEKSGIPKIAEGHMAAPCIMVSVDRKVFKQSSTERGEAYTAKNRHRKELQQAYGANWKKHLNVPEKKLSEPMRMQF
jgi:monoamine oxidase